jgi:hypothetical protein
MATKKKNTKKKAPARRRRNTSMRGFNAKGLMPKQVGAKEAAGFVLGLFLNKASDQVVGQVIKPTGDAKKDYNRGLMAAGAKTAVGIGGAMYIKDDFAKAIALGFTGGAIYDAMPFVLPFAASPYAAGQKKKVQGVGTTSSDNIMMLDMETMSGASDYEVMGAFENLEGTESSGNILIV